MHCSPANNLYCIFDISSLYMVRIYGYQIYIYQLLCACRCMLYVLCYTNSQQNHYNKSETTTSCLTHDFNAVLLGKLKRRHVKTFMIEKQRQNCYHNYRITKWKWLVKIHFQTKLKLFKDRRDYLARHSKIFQRRWKT